MPASGFVRSLGWVVLDRSAKSGELVPLAGQGVTVDLQRATGDSIEVVLRPPIGPSRVRALARLYGQRRGASEAAIDRLVQLVNEFLGPGLTGCLVRIEGDNTRLEVSCFYSSPGNYESFQWWRAQHPLGVEGWTRFVSSLSDAWAEQLTDSGWRLWALVEVTELPRSRALRERVTGPGKDFPGE